MIGREEPRVCEQSGFQLFRQCLAAVCVMQASAMRPGRAKIAVILLFVVGGLGYLGLRNEAIPQTSPQKLIIALPVLPHTSLMYVAVAKGYLTDEQLEVSLLPAAYGGLALADLLEGKANFAVVAEEPIVISVLKGNDLAIFADLSTALNDNAIIARRDRGIAAARDLTGKKVGVSFGSSSSYFLWVFLIKHKLAIDSMVLVDLPPDRIVSALADGSVDAVATWQPISLAAQAALNKNALVFTEATAHRTTMAAVGQNAFLKQHPEVVEKLVRGMLKAEQFMREHPEQTLNLVAGWLKIDAAALRPTLKQFDFSVNLPQSQLITLEDEARWARARGYAANGPLPNFLPHLYLNALQAARPERVTVLQ
jgi:NitT/TauT family transport system substrate-binding protein